MTVFPRSLSARIIVSLSLILVGALAVHSGMSASRQAAVLLREMRENASVTVTGMSDGITHALVIGDYAEIERYLMKTAELPRIERIQVLERDGAVLADAIREQDRSVRMVTDSKKQTVPAESLSELVTEQEHTLIIWKPVRAGTLLGWIKASFSTRELAEIRRTEWRSSLLLGILLIAGSSGLLLLILRSPLRAVRELASFARGLAASRGEQITVPSGSIELEQLGSALNHASRELASAEQRIIAERERLTVTLHSIVDGVITTDISGAIVLMNRVAEELTGWPALEAQGKRLTEVFRVIDGGSRLPLVNPVQAVVAGAPVPPPLQAVLVTRSRGERIIAQSIAPIVDRNGATAGTVLVFNDLTEKERLDAERRRLEEQLRQSQKTEIVGQLAGGIAHDFNNILSAIIGYTNILRIKISASDPLRSYVDKIVESANRAAILTNSLLAFGKKRAPSLLQHDLNGIVRGASGMLKRIIREDIEFLVDLCPEPVPIVADKEQIEQVLMTLVANARDAMPEGGRLHITTQTISAAERDGPAVVLTVRDTGIGMDRKTAERIFDPFPSAKEEGRGTGLGLSLASGIIQKHGGTITVESEPGKGASFRVLLPAGQGTAETAGDGQASFPPLGKETILLVEDDQAVRAVAKTCLEEYGYRILEAGSASEAIGICRKPSGPIHLLITDVILPGMDGKTLSDEIRKVRPDMKILFMSGYSSDIMIEKGLDPQEFPFMPKPIDFERLPRTVRDVLDAAGNKK